MGLVGEARIKRDLGQGPAGGDLPPDPVEAPHQQIAIGAGAA